MLHKALDQLWGDQITAIDGRVGPIRDVYFDDERWAVRYFVVDAGDWLPGREVRVPASAVQSIDWDDRLVRVRLLREEVQKAPASNF